MPAHSRTIIAIPVKNEEARIATCLGALIQQNAHLDEILLLLNNCADGTLNICQYFATNFPKINIIEVDLSGHFASAGEARRLALHEAAHRAGDGIILTTDADAIPPENWVAANLRGIAAGADVVCGMATLDPADAPSIPQALQTDSRYEDCLLSILDEIDSMIDPDPIDPWPRHQHHSGASIALRAPLLRKAGGAPRVSIGEDRALIQKLRRVDAKIRHAREISVPVSGRLEGRACGGMADTIKRRLQQRDVLTDEKLEPAIDAYRRALAKARLRRVFIGAMPASTLAADLLIGGGAMAQALRTPYFGAVWENVQRLSPVLQRRRVAFAVLPREIEQAVALRDQLREEITAVAQDGNNTEGSLIRDENAD